ncbi:MAG: branched-chain amino acid ABC transporter permease [Deltaproteobacteria bacterium]|jgi:branched-chain amino acid transport system permease protein|nr:branched-chain amino acid ABC transporter permease [Deltaproteobacteria bacterium]MBW2530982.1 branched-chain amino acid ABC transporter permease [Deltaproteobacteria bacterium]
MSLLLQNVLNGLSAGSLYALVAVGIVLIYKSSEVLNFAHGTLAMVTTFVAYEAVVAWGLSFGPAIVLAFAAAFALGAVIYRLVLHRAQEGGSHAVVMVTIGLLMAFEGVAGVIWGTDTKEFHHYFAEAKSFSLPSGLVLSHHDAWIIGAAVGVALLLGAFFRFTRIGIALRAVSQNPVAAQLMGVRVARVHAITWGLATVLAAVAGILIVPRVFLDPSMMFAPLLKAFAAAVLGGMRSVSGAIVGGWLLGVVETMVGAYVSTEFQASIAFVIIIVVLTVRPEGLLGKPEIKKV